MVGLPQPLRTKWHAHRAAVLSLHFEREAFLVRRLGAQTDTDLVNWKTRHTHHHCEKKWLRSIFSLPLLFIQVFAVCLFRVPSTWHSPLCSNCKAIAKFSKSLVKSFSISQPAFSPSWRNTTKSYCKAKPIYSIHTLLSIIQFWIQMASISPNRVSLSLTLCGQFGQNIGHDFSLYLTISSTRCVVHLIYVFFSPPIQVICLGNLICDVFPSPNNAALSSFPLSKG